MTVNAEIILEELPGSLLVPESAVTYDANKHAFVDIADAAAKGGKRHVPVKIGVGNSTKIQITEGLKAGDRVVLPS